MCIFLNFMSDSCTTIRYFVDCSICLKLSNIVVIQQLKKRQEVIVLMWEVRIKYAMFTKTTSLLSLFISLQREKRDMNSTQTFTCTCTLQPKHKGRGVGTRRKLVL